MPRFPENAEFSEKYQDECYEFRHIVLTKKQYKIIRDIPGLIPESIWRNKLGIKISGGWTNYARFAGEPHVLLLRRPLGMDPETGFIPQDILSKIEQYEKEKVEHLNKVNPDVVYEDFAKLNL